MSEAVLEPNRAKAVAATADRLNTLLHETRKDEDRLRRVLEMRRLKRRLRAAPPK